MSRDPAKSRDVVAPSGLRLAFRDTCDWIAALVLTILLAPVLAAISVAILLDTGRPVLFKQPRFGRNQKPFLAWKFRTMVVSDCDLSGARQTEDHDPRITRVGRILRKTSLDELPQLFNVLAGDMCLIGPRAHPCGMRIEGELCEDIDPRYHLRHIVRPGITGWAQVNGSRGAVKDFEALSRRVDLDLEYIRRWSPLLDIRIFFRTIGVALHSDRGQ